MDTSRPGSASPAPLADSSAPTKSEVGKGSTFTAVGVLVAAVALGLAATSPRIFIGFLLGVVCAVGGIIGGVYYLLNIAEAKSMKDKQDEIDTKMNQPQYEGKPANGADYSGFLQVLGPSARVPTNVWFWGDLKSGMILYSDLKGHSKGAIALTNARLTVIKTKFGRLWKSTNYIRLVNPDRALLGEYRECVLFFRNGKEMEEWYLALKVATTLHVPGSAATQSTRRQHFMNIMRTVGYNWQISNMPSVPRPASLTILPSEVSTPSSGSSSVQYPTNLISGNHGSHLPTSSSLPSSIGTGATLKAEDDMLSFGKDQSTSSKWFNLLAHRVFYFLNDDPGFVSLVKKKIAAKLAKLRKPSILKSLTLKGLSFGTKLPIVSNISIKSADPDGSLRLDADMAYHGNATVELDLIIEVELFGTKITTIPATIKVIIKSIVGKVQCAFSPPPSDLMWMGFYTEPHIDLEFSSFFGEKHRLINIPKITDIVVNKLKQEIVEMMLMPDMDDWPLPHLKMPKGVTREKYVVWEYQAGYTPPPKVKTEFDSSDSDIELESRSSTEKPTASPSSSSSSSASSSSSSKTFASTFASSVDVPTVQLKNRTPPASNGSSPSSTPGNGSTGSKQTSRTNKPVPPLPSHPPALPPKLSTASSAPITPVVSAAAPTINSQPGGAHHVPMGYSGHASMPVISSTGPTSAPVIPISIASSRSTSSVPQAKPMEQSSTLPPAVPARAPYRPPTPPKVHVQSFQSDVIPSDTSDADAIFGPFDPLTGENVTTAASTASSKPKSSRSPSPDSSAAPIVIVPIIEKTITGRFIAVGETASTDPQAPKPTIIPISTSNAPTTSASAPVVEAPVAEKRSMPLELDPLLTQPSMHQHIKVPLSKNLDPILHAEAPPEDQEDWVVLPSPSSSTATEPSSTLAELSATDRSDSSASTMTPPSSTELTSPPPSPKQPLAPSPEPIKESEVLPEATPVENAISQESVTPPAEMPKVEPPPTPADTETVSVESPSTTESPVVVEAHEPEVETVSSDVTSRSSLSAVEEVEHGPLGGSNSDDEKEQAPGSWKSLPGKRDETGSSLEFSPPRARDRSSSGSNTPVAHLREISGHAVPAKAPTPMMDQKPPLPPRQTQAAPPVIPVSGNTDSLKHIFDTSPSAALSTHTASTVQNPIVHSRSLSGLSSGDDLSSFTAASSLSGRPVSASAATSPLSNSGGADPFADIFTGGGSDESQSASSHSFQAALQPPPQLPPRPKKKAESPASSTPASAFPSDLYAHDQPSASDASKKKKSTTSASVKATFKSIFETIKDTASKLDD